MVRLLAGSLLLVALQVQGADFESALTNVTRACDCPVFAGEELTIHFSEKVAGESEYKLEVSSNGVLHLPLNQSLIISNQTEAQLAAQIANTCAKADQAANLVFTTVEPTRPFFLFPDAKVASRKFSYSGQMTLMRAIDGSGGFTDFSGHDRFVIVRTNGQRITTDKQAIFKSRAPDPIVCPGDTIIRVRRPLF